MNPALDVLVRDETPDDVAAVAAMIEAAFERDDEVLLVEALRSEGSVLAALVACDSDGAVLGHVLFSPLAVDDGTQVAAGAALAPLSVRPGRQRRGVGSALTRTGLDSCRTLGIDVVVVLGHPAYYRRFGFTPAVPQGLRDPFDAGAAFMALPLGPVRWRRPATVRYAPAFGVPA